LDVIRDFWWLIFPIFGVAVAARELVREDRRAARMRRWLEGQ
jgi:hypothetical protein